MSSSIQPYICVDEVMHAKTERASDDSQRAIKDCGNKRRRRHPTDIHQCLSNSGGALGSSRSQPEYVVSWSKLETILRARPLQASVISSVLVFYPDGALFALKQCFGERNQREIEGLE